MNLTEQECRHRVAEHRHGVLATRHPERGVDAVPVVYGLIDGQLVIPIDTIKAKRHTGLRRLANVAEDDRCVLLVDHYDDDWSQLWWVRVHARASPAPASPQMVAALARRYPEYGAPGAITQTLLLTPTAWYGWRA